MEMALCFDPCNSDARAGSRTQKLVERYGGSLKYLNVGSDIMNLDEAQKQTVAGWIGEGLKLAEIQKKLAADLGITMTYMELRFLIDDLKVKPKDPQPPPPLPVVGQSAAAAATPSPGATPLDPGAAAAPSPGLPGGVSLSVDQVTRAGALVSGVVTFSDGNAAAWYLDQSGRLGMAPKQQGYRPSAEDLEAFQMELQNELARLGM